MHFLLRVALLHFGILAIQSEHTAFTINKVVLKAEPNEIWNGNNLTLTCEAEISKVPGTDPLQPSFVFYKDDVQIFNTTSLNDEAHYIISPARFSHWGEYSCAVYVNRKNRKSEELPVRIRGVSAPQISVSKKEVKEGEKVTVRCEASEEKAPIIFKIFKVNRNDKQEKTRPAHNTNYVDVDFLVEEGDKNLFFECTAEVSSTFAKETSEASERLLVTVSEPFSTPSIQVYPSTNITEGDRLTVYCTVLASSIFKESDIEILIQKDKTILTNQKHDTSASYSKDLAVVADEGNYTCKAESGLASKTSSVYIHVTELFPRPALQVGEEISEGDALSFSCSVSGFKAENLTFYLEKINSTMTTRMKTGGKYKKTGLEQDRGLYVCKVTIRNITKKSEPRMVTVYAPVSTPVLSPATKMQEVVMGQTLILMCKSERGTPPITYTLFRGTEQLYNITRKTKGESAEFKLNVSTLSHLSGYRCKGNNKNKLSSPFSTALNFTVIAQIQKVILETIPSSGEVENGRDLTLMCRIIDGSWPVTFTFYRKDKSDHVHQEIINKSTSIWHQRTFDKEQEGSYYCTASNRASRIHSNILDIKVILASWKKAVIAVFVVLMAVGVAAAVTWWYLQKKRKAKQITVEMSGPVTVTNSHNEKPLPGQNNETESHCPPGFNEDGENHTVRPEEEKEDAGENTYARIEGCLDAT
ncbi:platelet endothelial cell adhesion molecule isoform X2 [Microcaecilia unicolor]|uniref:Platelet endothelial cell adhesion molecule n=1 Tax=Microcaecilia unicolor TaxID=1415580 RepID=A0A6P7Y9Z5_9AMPH|nr:platelet endothelial cell adhesion molecule isoform X2 [Microcaecilia unicolor]